MKEKDPGHFPIDAYDLDTTEDVDEEGFVDETEEHEYDDDVMVPQIFWDLGVSPVLPGRTPAAVNLFDLLKNGIGNTDVDLTVVFGMVLGFIRRFHQDDTIRLAWEELHNGLNDVLCDASATCEKRRETWVREAEQKYPDPLSIEQRNSHCFQNLFKFISNEIKPALAKLQPERYVVAKEVERYLALLEDRGDLGKWELPRYKGYVWYLKKWELPDANLKVRQRELSQRRPQRTEQEIMEALDVIPLSPIKPAHEMERMERREGGEKSPAKPVFSYAAHLPSRIVCLLSHKID